MKARLICVALVAAFLNGCQLGIDKEEDTTAKDVVRSDSSDAYTISEDELYSFTLTGTGNVVKLEDNLSEIVISGDSNVITIEDDELLDALTISGDGNNLSLNTDLTRITAISLSGENNTVIVTEYVTLESGNNNSVTGNQVSP